MPHTRLLFKSEGREKVLRGLTEATMTAVPEPKSEAAASLDAA